MRLKGGEPIGALLNFTHITGCHPLFIHAEKNFFIFFSRNFYLFLFVYNVAPMCTLWMAHCG